MHIFMARSRVSKSRLKAEVSFQRYVHFTCDPKSPTTLKPKYIQDPEGKDLLIPPSHEGIFHEQITSSKTRHLEVQRKLNSLIIKH